MGNQEITHQLQEIFNLLPDQDSEELVRAFAVETNDMMLALYLGSMLRSTVTLHNLINNKIKNKKAKEDKGKGKDANSKDAKDKVKAGDKDNDKNGDKGKDKQEGKASGSDKSKTS